MSDLPSRVDIQEEGPREGFQFEKGPIPTDRKIALIDALSETGLKEIQVGSFVNPKRVPGWADVDDVVRRRISECPLAVDGEIHQAGFRLRFAVPSARSRSSIKSSASSRPIDRRTVPGPMPAFFRSSSDIR